MDPRARIGAGLTGDVLEIGPGSHPFPTAPGAQVTFADKSVAGGRDENWPELIGEPWGPEADYDIDIDVEGLGKIETESLDVVIASHVLEHLANPIHALEELERVLRPGGKLVMVLPERRTTFDAPRASTPLSHVLEEHRNGAVVVSEDHIREFCAAIYSQPPIHPPEVRAWHDPAGLDAERIELHRRRSIHVHCWTAEEFASLLTGLLSLGLLHACLDDAFFHDDGGVASMEFGLVLRKEPLVEAAGLAFVGDWVDRVLDQPATDPHRIATFTAALRRDLSELPITDAAEIIALPTARLADRVEQLTTADREARAALASAQEGRLAAEDRASVAEADLAAVRASRSFRAGSLLGAPLHVVRDVTHRIRRPPAPP
jgi:Methyltransferase domain